MAQRPSPWFGERAGHSPAPNKRGGTAILAAPSSSRQHVVEALDDSQWPFVETIARLRHADLLLERGNQEDRALATAELNRVVAFWRRAGAPWYLERLRDWARERRLRLPASPIAEKRAVKTLTKREREVATLVTEGLTNRQIAERLVISERTVESHVERVMEKLSRHSRAEIAAWMSAPGRS